MQAQILRLITHLSHQSFQKMLITLLLMRIQSLDDHITEITYNETVVQLGFDPVDLILRRQRDEVNQAKASVASDAIVTIDTSDASPLHIVLHVLGCMNQL